MAGRQEVAWGGGGGVFFFLMIRRPPRSTLFPYTTLFRSVASVLRGMEALYETADVGRLYREGASVVIAGRPNVGKSSLFNALLRDARVIVTQHAGTTRDVIEDVITVDGIPVRLADMAGLRETDDEIERIGVERAWTMARESDLILLVVDASEPLCDADDEIFQIGRASCRERV